MVENRRTDGPQHGTVTIDQATGTFTYDPVDGYTGPDEFTVEVSDHTTLHFHGLRSLLFGRSHTDTATIRLTVIAANDPNDAPVAVDDTYSTGEDATLTVAAHRRAGQRHRRRRRPADRRRWSSGPANGTVDLNPDGSFTYTPDPDFSASTSFTYTASDGANVSDTATVTITVTSGRQRRPRSPRTDTYTVTEDATLTVPAPPGCWTTTPTPTATPLTAALVDRPHQRHR